MATGEVYVWTVYVRTALGFMDLGTIKAEPADKSRKAPLVFLGIEAVKIAMRKYLESPAISSIILQRTSAEVSSYHESPLQSDTTIQKTASTSTLLPSIEAIYSAIVCDLYMTSDDRMPKLLKSLETIEAHNRTVSSHLIVDVVLKPNMLSTPDGQQKLELICSILGKPAAELIPVHLKSSRLINDTKIMFKMDQTSVVDKAPCREDDANKRKNLFRELLETEESFVKTLAMLHELETLRKPYMVYNESYSTMHKPTSKTFESFVKSRTRSIREQTGLDITLANLQIAPIQRMPRISTLFNALLATVPIDHPDYNVVRAASLKAYSVSKSIDEKISQNIDRGLYFQIDKILCAGGKTISGDARFLCDLFVQQEQPSQKQKISKILVLYSHFLIIALREKLTRGLLDKSQSSTYASSTQQQFKYTFESRIDLAHVTIIDVDDRHFELVDLSPIEMDDQRSSHTHLDQQTPRFFAFQADDTALSPFGSLYAERCKHIDIYYNIVEANRLDRSKLGDIILAVFDDPDELRVFVDSVSKSSNISNKRVRILTVAHRLHMSSLQCVITADIPRPAIPSGIF
eukprot:jgi/Hompol1/4048/HPOL_003451-RA